MGLTYFLMFLFSKEIDKRTKTFVKIEGLKARRKEEENIRIEQLDTKRKNYIEDFRILIELI